MSSQRKGLGLLVRFFLTAVLLAVGAEKVYAPFVFSSRESRLRLADTTSRFFVDTAITGFNGTLELSNAASTRIQGDVADAITFSSGMLEQGTARALFTGVYNGSSTDTIKLTGSHRLCALPGTFLPAVTVSGTGNSIEGAPLFSSAIVLADSSTSVTLALQGKLNASVTMNGGTIVLGDHLALAENVEFSGRGNIDFGLRSLVLPGRDLTWTGTLSMINAGALELAAPFKLSGSWWFGSAGFGTAQTRSRSVIDGHGMVLDMSTCGTIVVRAGHTLEINNCVIKGLGTISGPLGGSTNGLGFFLMEDSYSTVSFNGCTFILGANYTLTQGTFYFYGAPCAVETGSYTFSARANTGGVFRIDNTVLEYSTLSSPDASNIIQPDGVSVISVNGGVVESQEALRAIFVDAAFYQQIRDESVSGLNRVLNFRGTSASNITWNGGGRSIQFARGTGQSGALVVAANKTVTLENVVLKDFSSACCSLGSGASLVFGNGVTIELSAKEDLSMTWSFTGQSTASTIRGCGHVLNLGSLSSNFVGISVGAGEGAGSPVNLWLDDVVVEGLTGAVNVGTSGALSAKTTYSVAEAYIASRNLIRCVDYTGVINLRNTDLNLAGNYTLSAGNINIYNDVNIKGKGYTFAFSSNGTLAIQSASTLYVDRNVTFSYDSSGLGARGGSASKNQLTMASQTSRLYLNGCTFYGTSTSPRLQTGVLVIDDKVVFTSEGTVDANAICLSDSGSLRVEVLAGAVFDIYGAISYI
ncbi:hypothetical protein FJ366_01115 [Candidatus Dependentiae bacterium]|nr:hypothetical protein [Candidatus Dependentiae bacterium]